jgi:hypothetical protein
MYDTSTVVPLIQTHCPPMKEDKKQVLEQGTSIGNRFSNTLVLGLDNRQDLAWNPFWERQSPRAARRRRITTMLDGGDVPHWGGCCDRSHGCDDLQAVQWL